MGLEDDPFLLGQVRPIFRGKLKLFVSGRVYTSLDLWKIWIQELFQVLSIEDKRPCRFLMNRYNWRIPTMCWTIHASNFANKMVCKERIDGHECSENGAGCNIHIQAITSKWCLGKIPPKKERPRHFWKGPFPVQSDLRFFFGPWVYQFQSGFHPEFLSQEPGFGPKLTSQMFFFGSLKNRTRWALRLDVINWSLYPQLGSTTSPR